MYIAEMQKNDRLASTYSLRLCHLYNCLPLPAACSAVEEILSESIFRFGKGTKVLTERPSIYPAHRPDRTTVT